MTTERPAIVWFRRDLRLHDHPALTAAIARHASVVPVFVLDAALLSPHRPSANRRWFMLGALRDLDDSLRAIGGRLVIRRGDPAEVVPALAASLGAADVYVSRDHTPYGRRRDRMVAARLVELGAALHALRGTYVHEPDEVATQDGRPFRVFSPFRRAWEALPPRELLPAPDRIILPGPRADGMPLGPGSIPAPETIGAVPTADPDLLLEPGERAGRRRMEAWIEKGRAGLDGYAEQRDRLDLDATSRLSADLRWGTISPTELLVRSQRPGQGAVAYAAELCWREFYAHVLWHEPRVLREPFDRRYLDLPWRDDPDGVAAWRGGRTGVPVVDAAMRQLLATGWMHNRARMIVASFLTKDLLVDWRVGERHFMEHLLDGDVASNDGGWQWTASTGTDPQPAFRIFNPVLQGRRFDPDGVYVRRWVPELDRVPTALTHEPWRMSPEVQRAAGCLIGRDYPAPVVDHAAARARALEFYGRARASATWRVRLPSACDLAA
jgi:deoxyribodipyrimidine photo-lyase